MKKNIFFNFFNILILIVLFFIVIKYFFSNEFYKFFYLKFIFLIGIYYLLFFSLKKIRDYFIIFIFSVIISFYTIEILFYLSSRVIVENIKIRSSQAEKLGIDFDTRSKFQFYQDYIKQDHLAVPSIPPNDYFVNYSSLKNKSDDLYSIAGISNRNTIFCNEGGERVVYYSDRHGFRNKDFYWNNDKIDIVLLGDSLAQGACVNDKDTIHERIIHYTKKSFLNLGYQGHGPLMQLASLKEYAKLKKPKQVIWFYSETNDIDNLIYEYQWDIFKKYLTESQHTQNLLDRQKEIDFEHIELIEEIYSDASLGDRQYKTREKTNLFLDLKSIIKLHKLRQFISFFIPRKYSLTVDYYSPLDTFKIYEQIIDEANNVVKSWGGELYFVYYPHAVRYFDNIIHPYPLTKYEHITKIMKEKKINIIDLKKEVFEKVDDVKGLYPLRISGHPDERGYDLVAKYISKILINE